MKKLKKLMRRRKERQVNVLRTSDKLPIRRFLAVSGLAVLLAVTGCAAQAPNRTQTTKNSPGQGTASVQPAPGKPAGSSGTSGGTAAAGQTAPAVVGLGIGDLAPDFSVPMSDGNTLKLSSLRGKPVLLNFWATWCPPCRMEMPDIQKIFKENYPVQIVGVNLKEEPMTVEGFLSRNGYTYPVGFDLKGKIASLYNVSGIPTSYAIDAKGIIRHVQTGPLTYAELSQWFRELTQSAK
ncbi:redoxin domain-containing protein [Acididesulfobacillus acetoxydans]|uniref:redoxin domain-containing protein n=1 Tax=Acididesulfobacillus acetoxydans TaxID=1561005 RepID=UPI001F0DD1D0|nr:redoxin domain-containing protein [Acididesulfobacillus acetoxydans]